MDADKGIVGLLNPTVGTGLFDKTGPLLVLLAWLGLGGALMFKLVPDMEFGQAVWGLLGLPVGAWLHKMTP